MATGTIPTPPPIQAPAIHSAPQARQTLQVIERQLGRTKFHVRLVDLLARFAVLVVGVLAFLIVAALVDHWWVLPLGVWGRTIAFLILLGGVIYYCATQIAPLFIRRINESYAARAIEESRPSLKNSLINFLMLRSDRSGVKEVVFEALERRAAEDISDVAVESAVDRAPVIRIGYVLLGVLTFCAAYKILSPKDPFTTFARIVAPWADIDRPSRVQIENVKPGDLTIYRGRSQTITATVDGVREGQPVKVLYSTADGQTVDREVPMKPGAGGLTFSCDLPPVEEKSLPDATKPGLQQDVTYRVVAGDAVTSDYRLTVVDAPAMVVEKVEYQFPAYTNKSSQTLVQGDLRALEGTKVTIHAAANQPIRDAVLEFDPLMVPADAAAAGKRTETVAMQIDGQKARVTLTLLLKPDHSTPWHGSYQVRFTNTEGARSEQPVVHAIEVIRDLAPEVQILAPLKKTVEVPENGSLPIEIRAVDPDYALSKLQLSGTSKGKTVLDEELLRDAAASPQAVAKHDFRPSEHKLVAGDEMTYFAKAADNRTSPQTGGPEPNEATTAQFVVRVVAPIEGKPQPEKKPGEKPQEKPGEKPEENPENKPGERPNEKPMEKPGEKNADQKTEPGEKPMTKPGEKPMPGEQPMPGENPKEKPGEKPMPGERPEEKPGEKGNEKKGNEQKGNDQKGNEKQQDKSSEPKKGDKGGQSSSGGSSNSEQKGNAEKSEGSGSGNKGSSSGGNEQPMEGSEKGTSGSGEQNSGKPMPGTGSEQTGGEGSEQTEGGGAAGQPGKTEHEGDAIEKILKHAEKTGNQNPNQNPMKNPGAGAEEPKPGEGTEPKGGQNNSAEKNGAKPGENTTAENKTGEKSTGTGEGQKTGNKTAAKPGDKVGEKSAEKSGEKNGSQTKPDLKDKVGTQQRAGEKSGDKSGQPMPMPGTGEKPQPGEQGKTGEKTKPGEKTQETGAKEAKGKEPGEGTPHGQPKGSANDGQKPKEKMGDGEKRDTGKGNPGEAGAGTGTKEKPGAADQESSNNKKKTQQPDGSKANSSEASPPGQNKESDSTGGESGDKKGGGKTGEGQQGNQAGNKTPGSNSVGDNGAPGANEKGKGSETGDIPGNDKKSDTGKGAAGEKSKTGSEELPGQGKEPGGKDQEKPGEEPGEATGPSDKAGSREATGDKTGRGKAPGGGKPGKDDGPQPTPQEAADADKANLDYARKATEMALEHLRDQKQEPDPALLKDLGWTKEELQEFVRRWEAMEKAAKENPAAKKELDESLRSLGIRPAKNRKRSAPGVSDNQRDLRDSGSRSSAPPSYREQFEQFRRGTGRSEP